MKPLKFKKSVAEGMARDIMSARAQILRGADPEETWLLMRLADDLKSLGAAERLETLANKYEAGNHYLAYHLEIEDEEAQDAANKMASDLRRLKSRADELVQEPVTEERLKAAEKICGNYGVKLELLNRTAGSDESFLN